MKFFGTFVVVIALIAGNVTPTRTYAHAGETHETESDATAHVESSNIKQLELKLSLLKQVVALLIQKRQLMSGTASTAVTASEPAEHEEDNTHEHEDGHEGGENETSSTTEEPKLVIELETHMGKTHVHVRYTDKPEEMFFANAAIDDTDALVLEIASKTGLAAVVVRAALTRIDTTY